MVLLTNVLDSLCLFSGPPVIAVSKQTRTISVGTNVTLTCFARASPPAVISWSKKGGQLPR